MRFYNKAHVRSYCAPFTLIMVLLLAAMPSAATIWQPTFNPAMDITKTSGQINIDGNLDDSGWRDAAGSQNFVERYPGDNIRPEVQTRVMVTYDNDNLYIAFICHDDPANIRATMCQRDQFYGDDAVTVCLDTYGNASWAYKFFVNPYGIQKDYLWTNIIGDDSGFDIIWNAAAQIVASGYQVEIAVPFSSIRFPNRDIQSWKMDFRRVHPRGSYHQYAWAASDRNESCDPCQWGTVSGISEVAPGHGIEILPSVIATQSGAVSDSYNPALPFDNDDIDGELSIGGKYAINSDITLEATVNPDFSQIEADAAQVDVNTTVALFFPERRPFFQEGQDIFRTLFNSFYTRTINDPQLAVKLTGRTGRYRFGFVSAVDENSYYLVPLEERSENPFNVGKSYINIFRAMRSFGESSQIGLLVNDRHYEAGGHNSVFAFDQNIRLSSKYRIDGQYIVTNTKEPNDTSLYHNPETFDFDKYTYGFDGESYTGYGFISRFRRSARNWNFFIDYNQVGRTYRTETGYDPWVNYRNLSGWTGYNIYFDKGLFERLTPQAYAETRWNFDGTRKWTHVNAAIEGRIRYAQTYVSLGFNTGDELWGDTRFSDLWNVHFDINSTFSNRFGCYLSAENGVNAARNVGAKGNEVSLSTGFNFKPFDRLMIEPDLNYLKSNHIDNDGKLYENYVLRTRFRFQATKALSIRLVAQYTFRDLLLPLASGDYMYNSRHWDIDPLITFRLSPFSVFYIGTTYDYAPLPNNQYPFMTPTPDPDYSSAWELSSRQFFMKLQYLFQI